MSIGSGTDGGVDHLLVDDLTIDGADNGIRIKSDRSRGGMVRDIVYENVCMRDVKNPIVLTTSYTAAPGDKLPLYRDIALRNVRSTTAGESTIAGIDAAHRIGVLLDNVFGAGNIAASHAEIRIGPRAGDFVPSGEDVLIDRAGAVPGDPAACGFPAFPR